MTTHNMNEYTVVIRTLGTAGEKYKRMLRSLEAQTMRPSAILVYIAEGYAIPRDTVGTERYIAVPKGMVAQRALLYDEVSTEYMLFLDDDVYLPPHAVEMLFRQMEENHADVISPDVFHNDRRPLAGKLMMALSGRMLPRRDDSVWGYRVMRTAGYSYNAHPTKPVYRSQTNAGPCFLCQKSSFLLTRFEDELWMDKLPYALGEDQVMYYKMHLCGLRQLTSYNTGIEHLDAGGNLTTDKERMLLYADLRFKVLFWYRFIYPNERGGLRHGWAVLCLAYLLSFALIVSLLKCRWDILRVKWQAIRDARAIIRRREVTPYKCVQK